MCLTLCVCVSDRHRKTYLWYLVFNRTFLPNMGVEIISLSSIVDQILAYFFKDLDRNNKTARKLNFQTQDPIKARLANWQWRVSQPRNIVSGWFLLRCCTTTWYLNTVQFGSSLKSHAVLHQGGTDSLNESHPSVSGGPWGRLGSPLKAIHCHPRRPNHVTDDRACGISLTPDPENLSPICPCCG